MGHLFALGVDLCAGRDDAIGLALDKRDFAVGLDDDVAGLTGGFGANDALHRDDLSGEGSLGAKGVHGETNLFQFEGHISALQLQNAARETGEKCGVRCGLSRNWDSGFL